MPTQSATLVPARVLAIAVSLGIAALAVFGAQLAGDAQHARAERDAVESLGRSTTALIQSVTSAVDAVDTIAARSTTVGGPASVAGLAVDARDDGVASVTWVPRGATPAASGTSGVGAATLDAARDQARLQLSPPFSQDQKTVVGVVRAVYRQGEVFTTDGGVGTSGQRRDRFAGWVVGIVPVQPLVEAAAEPSLGLVVHDGDDVLARHVRDSSDRIAASSFEIGGRVWTLTAHGRIEPERGAAFWFATVGALALFSVVVGGVRWGTKRSRRRDRELDGLRSQLAMIADIAPVVQHTLDLGAVLPAASVRVSDRLALAGVSFTFVDDHGRHTEVFAYGAGTDAGVAPVSGYPDGAPANGSIALSLQRGGRLGGILRARTTRSLTPSECAGLIVVAEMINSALVTARTFEQQAEAVRRFTELDALKSTFLETASHELRTPVTAIAGFARLAHEEWDELPEEQRRLFVDRIWANASMLDNLVADLLNFARMERGGLQAHNEPVPLSVVVTDVVHRLEPVFESHNIDADIAEGIVVSGERRSIEQVVTNLLSNAAKFSPDDSLIHVRLDGTNEFAVLTVDDQGPGVPIAERERVFSRFFRGRGPEVIKTRGAGIGLSVVKALADQMGATIEVGDAPSGGARFTVSFRREESHVAQS